MIKRLFITSTLFCLISLDAALANPIQDKYGEAMAALRNQEYQKAVELFEETLKLNSRFAQPYNFIAMAKKELRADPKEVIELLKKSIDIDPNFALAHDNLGKMYYGEGEFQLAKEHAQKAVDLDPALVTARLSLAWICLLGMGETGEAIEQFEEAIAIQKTDYGQFGLGMAYFMDHQRGKVLEMITGLRLEGNEKLATDLEKMIREGHYLPPKGLQSVLAPRTAAKEEEAPAEEPAIENIKYPVRLSGRLDESQSSMAAEPAPNAMTAAERIRQLQRNYIDQGPGY
ncbi:MAG TPA: tetratricopeptide repeat protein [Candidatus Omnitrophota bacterium]|nr:tetratricopeptide repeat protein [Candidatus Omnitrophota bacterium]